MRLSDVEHQEVAKSRLLRALAGARVPHAYLFIGPEGVGKQMMAMRFARLLLCPRALPAAHAAPDGGRETCGDCDDCRMLAGGVHPDYRVISRASHRLHPDRAVQRRRPIDISIDVVREFVINQMSTRPARGRAKIFVIDEAEMLTTQAENSLLKTLEEPPAGSYLILVATSDANLLPTIRSRCQVVPFGPLPTDYIVRRLSSTPDLSPSDARYVAELSEGRLGPAQRLVLTKAPERRERVLHMLSAAIRNPLDLGKPFTALTEEIIAIGEKLADARDAVVNRVDDDREEAEASEGGAAEFVPEPHALRKARREVLAMMAAALRDAMRLACGARPLGHAEPPDIARAIADLARTLGRDRAARAIRAVAEAEAQIDLNANLSLVLDGLGIALSRDHQGVEAA